MMLMLRCKSEKCTSCVQVYRRDSDDDLEKKRFEQLVRSKLPPTCPSCGGEIVAQWSYPYRDAGVGFR